MGHTLQSFAARCREILKAENNPAGRSKVSALLQDALKDEQFVASNLTDATPERKILYEDPELGFCILAHSYSGPKDSPPHDHGPSWAIYGQARGETAMSDWELVEPASPEKYAKPAATS
jgi:predicted metal-dependent enzyme (double-stranded beta helix superfamily)